MEDTFLYESDSQDFLLSKDEENIVKAMRKVDLLWKKYKDNGGGNNLILFCGGGGCSMRYGTPSCENEIETFPFIRNEGGDGSDSF